MVEYRAETALPYYDHERATAGLRGQLRLMSLDDGCAPEWQTMLVEGPVKSVGRHGVVRFKWTATVQAEEARPRVLPQRDFEGTAASSRL